MVVVDDHATFAELLALGLAAEPGLQCVGTARTAAEGAALVRAVRPDVAVLDVELGDAHHDGIDLAGRLIRELPGLRIVILTARVDARVMQRAATAGACALLPKSGPLVRTLHSIRAVEVGRFDVDPALLGRLVGRQAGPPPELTAREHEVLQLLAVGLDVRRIARHLTISEHTCRGHVKHLLAKLHAHSQLEAVVTAQRLGLLASSAPA